MKMFPKELAEGDNPSKDFSYCNEICRSINENLSKLESKIEYISKPNYVMKTTTLFSREDRENINNNEKVSLQVSTRSKLRCKLNELYKELKQIHEKVMTMEKNVEGMNESKPYQEDDTE